MIQAICTCGERYELRDDLAGKRIRCLTCSGAIRVPGRPSSGSGEKKPAAGARPRGVIRAVRDFMSGWSLTAGAIGGFLLIGIAWVKIH